jgi:hypothetical protein
VGCGKQWQLQQLTASTRTSEEPTAYGAPTGGDTILALSKAQIGVVTVRVCAAPLRPGWL